MVSFDSCLQQVQKQAKASQSTKFRRPGVFTNAVTLKPPITSLIQDADPADYALFNRTRQQSQPRRKTIVGSANANISGVIQKKIQDKENLTIDQICDALDILLSMYPAEGLDAQVVTFREQAQQGMERIIKQEETVEQQRQQLQRFEAAYQADYSMQDKGTIEALIRTTENEIVDLEAQLAVGKEQLSELETRISKH